MGARRWGQEDEEATTYSNVLFFDHPAGDSEWHVIFSGKTQRPRYLGHYI
jgi:hypothetical protein